MDESLMKWKLAEIIDSWDEEGHDPTTDEEAVVSILLLIEGHADDLLILSNQYGRADAAAISGFYALNAMRSRGVSNSVQSRFLKKLRLASCRLFDIQPEEMNQLVNNRFDVFYNLIRNAKNLTAISDEAALLFAYDLKHDRYVDFCSNSPVILLDFSVQSQIMMESKAFFQTVFPLVAKIMNKYGVPAPPMPKQPTYQPPKQPTPTARSTPVSSGKKKNGSLSWLPLLLCPVLFVAVLLFALPQSGDTPSATTDPPKVTAPAKTEPRSVLRQHPKPSHGHIFEELTIDGLAPFSVTGSGDIYLVLDPIDLSASADVGISQTLISRDENFMELRVFLRSGMTFETDVPLGKYEVYYATGDAWYGEEELFGPDTQYYKCDEIFDFTMDDEGYNGWTLTLTADYNGNLDTDSIPAAVFPK